MKAKIELLFLLVKRDYALQFAGTSLGIAWSFIQSMVICAIYILVLYFGGILAKSVSEKNSIEYILSGLVFWLPIQDMLLRSVSILSDNRQLIKRSTLGINLFPFIPVIQMFIHLGILFPILIFILILKNSMSILFIFSFIIYILTTLFILPYSIYLSRINIFLKDISPLARLILQVSFWTLPILYVPGEKLKAFLEWNPLYYPLELFRYTIIKGYQINFNYSILIAYIAFTLFFYYISKNKLRERILDHL
jgi:lipopolysaccharide transport system permease protein